MKVWFGQSGWGWRLWGISHSDRWFIGLSIKQPAACRCVDCEGDQPEHDAHCAYMRNLHAAQASPKRRPYNPSGSLSEYGIFPECDAALGAQQQGGRVDG